MEGGLEATKSKRVRASYHCQLWGWQMGENPDWDGMVWNWVAVRKKTPTPRDGGTVGAMRLGRDGYLLRCLVSLLPPPVHPHQFTINKWTYASLYLNSIPWKSMRNNASWQCKVVASFVCKLRGIIIVLGNCPAKGFRRMSSWLISVTCFSSFPLCLLDPLYLWVFFLPLPEGKYQWCFEDEIGGECSCWIHVCLCIPPTHNLEILAFFHVWNFSGPLLQDRAAPMCVHFESVCQVLLSLNCDSMLITHQPVWRQRFCFNSLLNLTHHHSVWVTQAS